MVVGGEREQKVMSELPGLVSAGPSVWTFSRAALKKLDPCPPSLPPASPPTYFPRRFLYVFTFSRGFFFLPAAQTRQRQTAALHLCRKNQDLNGEAVFSKEIGGGWVCESEASPSTSLPSFTHSPVSPCPLYTSCQLRPKKRRRAPRQPPDEEHLASAPPPPRKKTLGRTQEVEIQVSPPLLPLPPPPPPPTPRRPPLPPFMHARSTPLPVLPERRT